MAAVGPGGVIASEQTLSGYDQGYGYQKVTHRCGNRQATVRLRPGHVCIPTAVFRLL